MRNLLQTLVFAIATLALPASLSAQNLPVFTGDVVDVDGTVYSVEAVMQQIGLVNQEIVVQEVDLTIINTATGEAITDTFAGALDIDSDSGCGILFLDVQPIFLDLLGLQLQTSQIVLDLSAVAGQGNLLGNLLCIVTGLLDGPGLAIELINNIINVINSILDALSP